LSFEYRQIDIRTLDGERLLESDAVGDNVIAILAKLRDDEGRSAGSCSGSRVWPRRNARPRSPNW
jgi:hypothetical protein